MSACVNHKSICIATGASDKNILHSDAAPRGVVILFSPSSTLYVLQDHESKFLYYQSKIPLRFQSLLYHAVVISEAFVVTHSYHPYRVTPLRS